jgi:DNA polymerase-4
LPVRVGIGAGKFLARIAAEQVPGGERGVVRVPPGDESRFLGPLPASRLDGVGRKTAAALAAMGGHTIADVVRLGRDRLQAGLGPHGLRIFACATGTEGEPVRGTSQPKSLSRESTLPAEPLDVGVFSDQLAGLAQQLEEELTRMGLAAGRVTVKIRFSDQSTTTRSATLPRPTATAAELFRAAQLLLERTPAGARPARGLGIQLSLLAPAGETDRQLDLFSSS